MYMSHPMCPRKRSSLYSVHYSQPVHMEIRVPKTRWVVLRYPSSAMAQQAGMSTEAFEDFFFKVCTLDYRAMSRAMDPLVELMQRTDKVRLTARGTDLRFSIKGQTATSNATASSTYPTVRFIPRPSATA